MHAFLVVKNGYEGIEEFLGLCATLEEAMSRREAIQNKCLENVKIIHDVRKLETWEEQDAAWEALAEKGIFPDHTTPDQICVRELKDDGSVLTVECVSNCSSYRFMG